jgi:hypothetical protein
MGQLEWYYGIDAAHQHSAYTLAWRLCRNEETAVKGFIPTAVDIAYKSVRRRDRRMRASDTRRCRALRPCLFRKLWPASVRDGHVSTRKSFVVEDGQRGLVDA